MYFVWSDNLFYVFAVSNHSFKIYFNGFEPLKLVRL